jgi:hypothetical protein
MIERRSPELWLCAVKSSEEPVKEWQMKAEARRDLSTRINKLPKWARDYIHRIETFVGAPEVQELTYLRDQNRQLIKFVAELKAENRRLQKRLSLQR